MYYNNNIEEINKIFPQYTQILKSSKNKKSFKFFQSKNGDNNAYIEDKPLHSNYNPTNEGINIANSIDINIKNLIIFDPGFFYTVFALSNKKQIQSIFLIIPDILVFDEVIKHIDIRAIIKQNKYKFIFLPDKDIFTNIFATVFSSYLIIDNSTSTKIYNDIYNVLINVKKDAENAKQVNQNTLKKYGASFEKNFYKNIFSLKKIIPINSIKNYFTKTDALIIAAGPTIDNNVEKIKKIAAASVVIVCDTAINFVVKHNIKVDFVITGDVQLYNFFHFFNIKKIDAPIVAPLVTHPQTFSLSDNKIILYKTNFILEELCTNFFNIDILNSGGTITSTAYSFAKYIGCLNVFFAGLDLSYPDNLTHYKGAFFEIKKLSILDRFNNFHTFNYKCVNSDIKVISENYVHKQIISDKRLLLYKKWFENTCVNSFSLSDKSIEIKSISLNLPTNVSIKNDKNIIKVLEQAELFLDKNKIFNFFVHFFQNIDKNSKLFEFIHELSSYKKFKDKKNFEKKGNFFENYLKYIKDIYDNIV